MRLKIWKALAAIDVHHSEFLFTLAIKNTKFEPVKYHTYELFKPFDWWNNHLRQHVQNLVQNCKKENVTTYQLPISQLRDLADSKQLGVEVLKNVS